MKYQFIALPDGMVGHLFGPFPGSRHDVAMLKESALVETMQDFCNDANGPYYVYGDQGYHIQGYFICPWKGAFNSVEQEEFNRRMKSVRELSVRK